MRIAAALPFWFDALSEDLAYAVRQRTSVWLGKVLRISAMVLGTSGALAVATKSHPSWLIYSAFASAIAIALLLDRAHRPRAAAVAISVGFWLTATAAVFLLGGVRSPGTFVYLPIVLTAALFWSWGAAAALTAATLLVEIAALWLDAAGLLPPPMQVPSGGPVFRIFAASLAMTAVLVGVALHCLRGALADVRRYALRTEELLVESPDVLASFDRLGLVLAVSETVRDRTGYQPGELVGRHHSRIDLFAGDRAFAGDQIRRLAQRGGVGARPIELTRKDGSALWGEARAQLIAVDDGEPRVRVVLYDVTRRKLAEDRRAELERLIERSKRLEAMGLLVGGITHDLNNLLTVILTGSQVLDLQLPVDSPAREVVRDVTDSASRATTLARKLLEARPAGGKAEAIDVAREIESMRSMLSRLVGERIDLVVRVEGAPCFVHVDPVHLEQIALNLAVNARDAMPHGGELVIETARGIESDEGDGPRQVIVLSVTDSGVGMDETTRRHAFEPFFTTKGRSGTGLGLATVDGIVARLGGRIRVESAPGRGTRVSVLLPEAQAEDIARAIARQTAGGIRLE